MENGGKSSPQNLYNEDNSPHFIIFGILNFSLVARVAWPSHLLFSKSSSREELTLSSGDFECHPRKVFLHFFRRRISL